MFPLGVDINVGDGYWVTALAHCLIFLGFLFLCRAILLRKVSYLVINTDIVE